jgi:NAD(P)-dependent dehydrogenase (short-subunit alcohol dehydrogenase family)
VISWVMAITVFITGADRGLGEALVTAWAGRGANVFAGVMDSRLAGTERTQGGGWIERLALDVSDGPSVDRAVRPVQLPLDILVNNAGILGNIDTTVLDALDFEEMERVYNVNALGSLRVTQALLPRLMEGQTRTVVNISSEAGSIGQCGRTGWFAYAMAKAALNMQSALVHNTLRHYGGRVLVLHPGHVRTFMRGAEDVTGVLSPAEAAQAVLANVERPWKAAEHPAFLGPLGEELPW